MKKLLGKLFGGKEESSYQKMLPRSPRLRLPVMDGAQLIVGGVSYPIRNLSETGLAVEASDLPKEISGEIVVGGQRAQVKALAVRRNGSDVGLSIQEGAAEVRGLLRRAFSDEFRALEMTEVDAGHQKAVELGQPRWFYAPGNYELFFVEHEGRIIRLEIEWNGQLLVYLEGGSLRFGIVDVEAGARSDGGHARSDLVKWALEVEPATIRKARRLVENIPGLDAASRGRLQKILG